MRRDIGAAVDETVDRKPSGGGVFASDAHASVKWLFLLMAFLTLVELAVLASSILHTGDDVLSALVDGLGAHSIIWHLVRFVGLVFGCVALYQRWHWPVLIVVYVIGSTPFFNALTDWVQDDGIHLSKLDNTMSALSEMAIGLWVLSVFAGWVGSRPLRAYLDGLPSSHLIVRSKGLWQRSTDPSWRRAEMLWLVLLPVCVVTTLWSIWKIELLDETDASGLRQYGYARIEVQQTGHEEMFFHWNGNPVSCVKLWDGKIDRIHLEQPIWMALSLEPNRNCMTSPVRYGLLRDDCADSADPVKLEKGRMYTVGIGRHCGLKPALGVGQAYREFVVR
jgi:hypothetical protein